VQDEDTLSEKDMRNQMFLTMQALERAANAYVEHLTGERKHSYKHSYKDGIWRCQGCGHDRLMIANVHNSYRSEDTCTCEQSHPNHQDYLVKHDHG